MVDGDGGPTHRGAPREDMLFAGTGRSLFSISVLATVSVLGVFALTSLIAGIVRPRNSVPRWEWGEGLGAVERLGESVLDNAWALLGFFATVLVAVALAGRGTFSTKLTGGRADTAAGLLRGDFDGRPSVQLVGWVGFSCGVYLAIAALLVAVHAGAEVLRDTRGPDLYSALTVVPLMAGGVVLASHVGVFVTNVDVRLAELEVLRGQLEAKCARLRALIGPTERMPPWRAILATVWGVLSIALVPVVVLGLFTLFGDVMWGQWWSFVVVTVLASATTVATPLVMDGLGGWGERILHIWWACVLIVVHMLWLSWVLFIMISVPSLNVLPGLVAGVAYGLPVVVAAIDHWDAVRKGRVRSFFMRKWSPFYEVDAIMYAERRRQLERVEAQISELRGGEAEEIDEDDR